jgi:hypothetical protein
MKTMASIKEVLENIESLDINDQTYVFGVKSGTLDDLWDDLNDL